MTTDATDAMARLLVLRETLAKNCSAYSCLTS